MGFFRTIRSAFYDPAFYAGMRDRSWGEAAKYYAVIAFVIVFAFAAPVWTLLLNVRAETVDTLAGVYPNDLEVTLANGVLSTNQPQPYAIKNTYTTELPENLVVFSTENDEYTPTSLSDERTIVLLKRTFAVVQSNENGAGDQRIFPYSTSTATTTLTKADVTEVAETIKPYVRPVAIVGGAFLFVLVVLLGGAGMLLFQLLYALLPALLVYLYFKIRKRDETFRTAYTTALFASIPVTIIATFALFFGGLPSFMYTMLVLIIVVLNDSRAETRVRIDQA
jgi:hypothetical protein